MSKVQNLANRCPKIKMAGNRNQNRGQNQNQNRGQNRNNMSGNLAALPHFYGEPQEDFGAFLNKFEKVTTAMGVRYPDLINFLPLCLEDFAGSEFDSLPP